MVDLNGGDAQGNVLVKAVVTELAVKLGLNAVDLQNRVTKADEGGGMLGAITRSASFPGAGRELGSLRARMSLFLREYSDTYGAHVEMYDSLRTPTDYQPCPFKAVIAMLNDVGKRWPSMVVDQSLAADNHRLEHLVNRLLSFVFFIEEHLLPHYACHEDSVKLTASFATDFVIADFNRTSFTDDLLGITSNKDVLKKITWIGGKTRLNWEHEMSKIPRDIMAAKFTTVHESREFFKTTLSHLTYSHRELLLNINKLRRDDDVNKAHLIVIRAALDEDTASKYAKYLWQFQRVASFNGKCSALRALGAHRDVASDGFAIVVGGIKIRDDEQKQASEQAVREVHAALARQEASVSLRGLTLVRGTDEECSELGVEVVGDVGVSCLLMTVRSCFKRAQMGFVLDEELRTSIMNLSHVGGNDEPALHNTIRSVQIGDLLNVASDKSFGNIHLRSMVPRLIPIVPAATSPLSCSECNSRIVSKLE